MNDIGEKAEPSPLFLITKVGKRNVPGWYNHMRGKK